MSSEGPSLSIDGKASSPDGGGAMIVGQESTVGALKGMSSSGYVLGLVTSDREVWEVGGPSNYCNERELQRSPFIIISNQIIFVS